MSFATGNTCYMLHENEWCYSVLLSGTVVGENPDHVCWEGNTFYFTRLDQQICPKHIASEVIMRVTSPILTFFRDALAMLLCKLYILKQKNWMSPMQRISKGYWMPEQNFVTGSLIQANLLSNIQILINPTSICENNLFKTLVNFYQHLLLLRWEKGFKQTFYVQVL